MITITLNQIRKASPHLSLWEKVLDAHEHLGMDTPFPLNSVLESNELGDTLWCLNVLNEEEILTRFALWCARQVQHLMKDERSIKALDVAEMFLDGKATKDELDAARDSADDAAYDATHDAGRGAYAVHASHYTAPSDAYAAAAAAAASDAACAFDPAAYASDAAAYASDAYASDAYAYAQINKLKEMLS